MLRESKKCGLQCTVVPRAGAGRMVPVAREKTLGKGENAADGLVLDLTSLKPHFTVPLHEAAKAIGVCASALKKVCRKIGIKKWPYRKIKTVERNLRVLSSRMQCSRRKDLKRKFQTCRAMLLQGKDVKVPKAAEALSNKELEVANSLWFSARSREVNTHISTYSLSNTPGREPFGLMNSMYSIPAVTSQPSRQGRREHNYHDDDFWNYTQLETTHAQVNGIASNGNFTQLQSSCLKHQDPASEFDITESKQSASHCSWKASQEEADSIIWASSSELDPFHDDWGWW